MVLFFCLVPDSSLECENYSKITKAKKTQQSNCDLNALSPRQPQKRVLGLLYSKDSVMGA